MTPLRGLDRIDWTALRHAYGPAGDVPDLLRGIAEGPDPGDALDDLDIRIFHQGGFVCSAAAAALPYLTAMAASPAIAVRPGVLELIGRLVHEANTPSRHEDRSHVDSGWPGAWAAALPDVLALLGDPDVAVRRELTSTLSAAIADADTFVPALRERWAAESDRAVRIGIVLAVGELAGGCTARVLPEALGWLRDLRGHDDAQIRAAAEIALAEAVAAQRPDLGVLVDAVSGDIAVWRDVPWVGDASADLAGLYGGAASRLLGWFDTRLTDAAGLTRVTGLAGAASAHGVDARTRLATAFAGAGDADRRIGAVRIAADLLSGWRSPARTLLPALAERTTDPSPVVRRYATHLLAALDEGDTDLPEGMPAELFADLLAERLDDTAPLARHGSGRISDLAAWGLARRRDPRCLPHLIERLGGDVSFVDAVSGPSGPFSTSPPSMRHVLAPLGMYADTLLPVIRERLGEAGAAGGFADVLEQWGQAAAPALPELIRLLETDAAVHAARAIAAIGPPAGAAAPALVAPREPRGHREDRQPSIVLPWALWKVTGDPDPLLTAVDTLLHGGVSGGGGGGGAGLLRYIADLGPLAAHHATRLRPLLDVRNDWTRVEAAHAYHAVTGDADAASAPLTREIHELAAGRYLPVRWAAARYLTAMTPGNPGVRVAARAILASDRRHHWATGWRAFAEDHELRTLASLLAQTTEF